MLGPVLTATASGSTVAAQLPELLTRVLDVLPSASIVIEGDDVVAWSQRSEALGIVARGQVMVPEIVEQIERTLTGSVATEQEMRVRRPPLGREFLELRVRAASIGSGLTLVLVDDLSEERRVEAVRRDFVANVSHELKTPVGALSLLAEAISSASDDPEQVRHFAARMQTEATRLGSLISDITDLSRLQGDDPLTHARIIDVDELVAVAIDEVRTVAVANQIEVVVGEPSHSEIFGSRTQIAAAVRNLLANAIAYSPAGSSVAIEAKLADSIVEILVKDQGIGIPANDLDRIFERFYRVDPARSRVTGGTGLGLAIVKHVCQNHGGECTVWSELGVGSTFVLRLPAYRPDSNADIEVSS